VHGGPRHHLPERIDAALEAELRSLIRFAPLHLPAALDAIAAATARFPGVPQDSMASPTSSSSPRSESGWEGISGTTADMKELLQRRASDSRAELAVQVFVLSCLKAIGGFAAVLGGLDTLVFTGGIGENAAEVRAEICARLRYLGLVIDAAANASGRSLISANGSACAVWVVPTDEERIIARHARTVLEKCL